MKKVLFATTALVGSAGIAAADIALSGSGEMGVFGGTGMNLQFHTDVDVTFTMSGETDGGLSFGISVDLDESGPVAAGTAACGAATCLTAVGNGAFANDADDGGIAAFVSGNFGTLTMGDTDGALDWALTEVAIGGTLRDDETTHAGYSGNGGFDGANDGQVARYDYSFGNFSFAASAELDDNAGAAGNGVATSGGGVGSTIYGVGAKYSMAMSSATVGLGVGYQAYTNASWIGASIDANFDNGFRAILNYSQRSGAAVANVTHYAIGLGYTTGAWTFGANYGQMDFAAGGPADRNGWAAVINYALGGGATLQAGYASSNITGAAATNTYSFGLAMSF